MNEIQNITKRIFFHNKNAALCHLVFKGYFRLVGRDCDVLLSVLQRSGCVAIANFGACGGASVSESDQYSNRLLPRGMRTRDPYKSQNYVDASMLQFALLLMQRATETLSVVCTLASGILMLDGEGL